jgi:hypothetical protein
METDKIVQLTDNLLRLAAMVKRVSESVDRIEKTLKQHDHKIQRALEQSSQSERNSDDGPWEGFGPKPEKQPFNPNAETYTLEVSYGPQTIRRDDGEDDNTWAVRKKCLMNRRVLFLNSSGVVGTPEQEAYLKEIYDRLTAHGR